MTAATNTRRMLAWWSASGVDHADLAVRRSDATMIIHARLALAGLHLGWARAENARQADVYIRPARDRSWRLVFLDDVALTMARRVVDKYAALAIQTSVAGGCHLWLRVAVPLDEAQRAQAQRWLAGRVGADPASTSGEHLGRLAGFRNCKRAGEWVNVAAESRQRPAWDPAPALAQVAVLPSGRCALPPARDAVPSCRDRSPSGMDWSRVCTALEAGADPAELCALLASDALPRKGRSAGRYADRTIRQALRHVRAKEASTRPPFGG